MDPEEKGFAIIAIVFAIIRLLLGAAFIVGALLLGAAIGAGIVGGLALCGGVYVVARIVWAIAAIARGDRI